VLYAACGITDRWGKTELLTLWTFFNVSKRSSMPVQNNPTHQLGGSVRNCFSSLGLCCGASSAN